MKRQFSDQIEIEVLSPSSIASKSYSTSSDVIFEETVEESSQGTFYKQSVSVIIDRDHCPELIRLAPNIMLIAKLNDATDNYTWGDRKNPVKCIVAPRLERCEFQMSRKALLPLIR